MDSQRKPDTALTFLTKQLDNIKRTSELINIRCTNLKTKKVSDQKLSTQNDVLKVVNKINLLCDLASEKFKIIQDEVNVDYHKWLKSNDNSSDEVNTEDYLVENNMSEDMSVEKDCSNDNFLSEALEPICQLDESLPINGNIVHEEHTNVISEHKSKNVDESNSDNSNILQQKIASSETNKSAINDSNRVAEQTEERESNDEITPGLHKNDILHTSSNRGISLEDCGSSSNEPNDSNSSNKENVSAHKTDVENPLDELEKIDTPKIKIEHDTPKIMLKCVDINKLINPNLKTEDPIIILSDSESPEDINSSRKSILKQSLLSTNNKKNIDLLMSMEDKKFHQTIQVMVSPYNKKLAKIMKKHNIQKVFDQNGKKVFQLPKANIKLGDSDEKQKQKRNVRQRRITRITSKTNKIVISSTDSTESHSDTEKNTSVLKSSLKNGNRSLNDSKNLKVTFAESPCCTDIDSDASESLTTIVDKQNDDKMKEIANSNSPSLEDDTTDPKKIKENLSTIVKEADALKNKLLESSEDDENIERKSASSESDSDRIRSAKRKSRSERNKTSKMQNFDTDKESNSDNEKKQPDKQTASASDIGNCQENLQEQHSNEDCDSAEKSADSESSSKKDIENKMEESLSKKTKIISNDESEVNYLTNLSSVEFSKSKEPNAKKEKNSSKKSDSKIKKTSENPLEGDVQENSDNEKSSVDNSNNDTEMPCKENNIDDDIQTLANKVIGENLLASSSDEGNKSDSDKSVASADGDNEKSKISVEKGQSKNMDKENSCDTSSNTDLVNTIENNSAASDDVDGKETRATEKRKKGCNEDEDDEVQINKKK